MKELFFSMGLAWSLMGCQGGTPFHLPSPPQPPSAPSLATWIPGLSLRFFSFQRTWVWSEKKFFFQLPSLPVTPLESCSLEGNSLRVALPFHYPFPQISQAIATGFEDWIVYLEHTEQDRRPLQVSLITLLLSEQGLIGSLQPWQAQALIPLSHQGGWTFSLTEQLSQLLWLEKKHTLDHSSWQASFHLTIDYSFQETQRYVITLPLDLSTALP